MHRLINQILFGVYALAVISVLVASLISPAFRAAAYAPIRSVTEATIPEDLRAAIEASPPARRKFRTLGKMNLFALAFRTNNMKTPAGRAKKIAQLVAMLARGETIVPERPKAGGRKPRQA